MARTDKPAASAAAEGLSFEDALARLEEIVEGLEGGELALEEALARFEEGVGLSRRCADALGDAERRIDALVGDQELPFAPEDDA